MTFYYIDIKDCIFHTKVGKNFLNSFYNNAKDYFLLWNARYDHLELQLIKDVSTTTSKYFRALMVQSSELYRYKNCFKIFFFLKKNKKNKQSVLYIGAVQNNKLAVFNIVQNNNLILIMQINIQILLLK